ncbi:MAG: ribose-phosphate diphosphokinase [Gammaproteobacteria bacterium]|nr:ribose-phosphate diphosphokinase [Gammaproteobacteria bacterium]
MAIKLVYACQAMQTMANSMEGTGVHIRQINWKTFRDGYPDLIIPDVHEIRGNDVVFLASMENPRNIFEQLSVIYAMPRYGARSLTIVLPYFPTATKDRVDEEGEIVTAKTLARMFSATPLSMHGPARLVIFDIHALQERFYFDDTVVPHMASAIHLLKEQLALQDGPDDIAIAFPDEGAWKRFHRFFEGYPQIICHKVRQGDKRIVTIKEGDPRDCHVVIVDDLVMTGGTLDECTKVCFAAGAKKVSAFVTHAVFPQESWKHFVKDKLDNFWITDSCPDTVRAINHVHPFKLLPLADTIRRDILITS